MEARSFGSSATLALRRWGPELCVPAFLRVRAIEDQAFVVAAAQWGIWGPEGRERRNFGNSLVVDPWGRVVARAADGVGVTFAELDLDEVRRVREILPALRHRRLNLSC